MLAKGSKNDIVIKGKDNDTTVEENEHEKKEMRIGKPKVMYQVLWEGGWIDTSKLYYYAIRGKWDEKGRVVQETSMIRLMDKCRYFEEEDTKLQYI